jgi:hypothetical protein
MDICRWLGIERPEHEREVLEAVCEVFDRLTPSRARYVTPVRIVKQGSERGCLQEKEGTQPHEIACCDVAEYQHEAHTRRWHPPGAHRMHPDGRRPANPPLHAVHPLGMGSRRRHARLRSQECGRGPAEHFPRMSSSSSSRASWYETLVSPRADFASPRGVLVPAADRSAEPKRCRGVVALSPTR